VFGSLGAPSNVAKPTKDSSVAIFWLGAVGLIAADGAKIASASRMICVITEMTDWKFDLSVKCTGHIDVCFLSLNFLDWWGVAVLIGSCVQDTPLNFLNERTLKGTFFENSTPRLDIPSIVEKYLNKELELEKFITHTLPILLINKAF
uniref:alcohol dehydrogenase n=1 Tax=Solanum lycopersicum TaxID=4081 RepID=A0A3Q7I2L1_SOLLC